MCTCCSSGGSSTINSWANMSPIRDVYSFESLHSNGKSLIAWRRIWMLSSSHKSSEASIALSAKFGKCLKNLPMNWDAKRFSLSEPLTASIISWYSFSCCEKMENNNVENYHRRNYQRIHMLFRLAKRLTKKISNVESIRHRHGRLGVWVRSACDVRLHASITLTSAIFSLASFKMS